MPILQKVSSRVPLSVKLICPMEEITGLQPDDGQVCGATSYACVDCGRAAGCCIHVFYCSDCGLTVCMDCQDDHACEVAA